MSYCWDVKSMIISSMFSIKQPGQVKWFSLPASIFQSANWQRQEYKPYFKTLNKYFNLNPDFSFPGLSVMLLAINSLAGMVLFSFQFCSY